MLTPLDVLKIIAKKFEVSNLEYFLVGSLAATHYGQPRLTNDIDLVVRLMPRDLNTLLREFCMPEYYCPPEEILSDEILRKGQFSLIHQESMIKIDIDISKNTAFYKSEFTRMKKVEIVSGFEVFVASPEDVILMKLEYFRIGEFQKHLSDIRGILTETKVDQNYLDTWIAQMGLSAQWEKV